MRNRLCSFRTVPTSASTNQTLRSQLQLLSETVPVPPDLSLLQTTNTSTTATISSNTTRRRTTTTTTVQQQQRRRLRGESCEPSRPQETIASEKNKHKISTAPPPLADCTCRAARLRGPLPLDVNTC